jgi:oligopeptide/dipeptide ABC transporter ATP-binding protein
VIAAADPVVSARADTNPPLLAVRGLTLALNGDPNRTIVDGVSFEVSERGVFGIVGESGCGKSVTALSLLRVNQPIIEPIAGEILFEGTDLLRIGERRLRQIRGGEIAMIFQEPMTSLNPVLTAGYQITEALAAHRSLGPRAARATAIELLSLVGIPSPETRMRSYPHQLSGGMCQRVMIALALACRPRLLIADEPTTALDVTIQAQIIELLRSLQRELGMTVIIITHDLGLISDFADTVAVMYAGRIVERATASVLFRQPAHPYTERLLASIPPVDSDVARLSTIEGSVPSIMEMPSGCRFSPRCPYATSHCREVDPKLREHAGGFVACHYPRRAAADAAQVP